MKCYLNKENFKILDDNMIGLNVFSKEMEKYIEDLKLEYFKIDDNFIY